MTLTYLRVLEFPDDVSKVDRLLRSPSRHDAWGRETDAVLEVFGCEVIYAYPSGE